MCGGGAGGGEGTTGRRKGSERGGRKKVKERVYWREGRNEVRERKGRKECSEREGRREVRKDEEGRSAVLRPRSRCKGVLGCNYWKEILCRKRGGEESRPGRR